MIKRAVCVIAMLLAVVATSSSCKPDEKESDCFLIHTDTKSPPVGVVDKYHVVIHNSVPAEKVGGILDAMSEWVEITQGKVIYDVSYATFDVEDTPKNHYINVYVAPKTDPKSNVIGLAWSWGPDTMGRPTASRIWIDSSLDEKTHFLTALHEFGHSLGLDHSDDDNEASIMISYITDVGSSPTCYDRKDVCKLWGCSQKC